MMRTHYPIVMNGGPLVNLTLESFLKVEDFHAILDNIFSSYKEFNILSFAGHEGFIYSVQYAVNCSRLKKFKIIYFFAFDTIF